MYDKIYKDGKLLEQINDYQWYETFEVKGPPLVSNRDFCLLKAKFFSDENGEYHDTPVEEVPTRKSVALAVSCERDDCPEKKKVVRADLIIGGWICEPLPDDPSKTFGKP